MSSSIAKDFIFLIELELTSRFVLKLEKIQNRLAIYCVSSFDLVCAYN